MDGLIIMSGRKKTQQCLYQLAGQKAPEISVNSRNGNQEENKEETHHKADHTVGEGQPCLSQAVQDTGQSAGDIHERTQKAQDHDEASGKLVLIQQHTQKTSEEQEHCGKQDPEAKAVPHGFVDSLLDGPPVSGGLGFGYHGKEQNADGAGDGAGKKDQGQGHSRENSVGAKGRGVVITVGHQPVGDKDRFHALQKIDDHPVQGQRHCKPHKPCGNTAKGSPWKREESAVVFGQYVLEVGLDRNERYDHGGSFPDYKPDHGEADGGSKAPLQAQIVNDIYAPYPHNLFGQLTQGRDGCLFYSIEISVDTGMDGCHGNGEGYDAKERSRALLQQKIQGNFIRVTVNTHCAQDGNDHGDHKSHE